MNIQDYINRINYKGDLTPNLVNLQHLQKTHLLNVPFENLDIHTNQKIILDLDKIHHKIIGNNRGGFCYELNGLFNTLLQSLGYQTKMISARVYNSTTQIYSQEYDHLAIMVTIDQTEYIVDVGFGEFTFFPLKFELDTIQNDPRGQFIIETHDDAYFKISKTTDDSKTPEYIFTTTQRSLSEFSGMCHYHQTSDQSHFTQKRLITRPTEDGRITISGNTLKIKTHDSTEIINFGDSKFNIMVSDWFSIDKL